MPCTLPCVMQHYIWGWNGERYSMNPEVARLLRKAAQPGGRAALGKDAPN